MTIPTSSAPDAVVADGAPLHVILHVRDAAALARVLGVPAPAPGAESLSYVMAGYPVIQGAASGPFTEPSFVIDFRDPAVAQLSAQFAASRAASTPADALPAALVQFVSGTVRGSYDRGFDIASQTAQHREGDCKTYAVLTTALARAAGIPARVVFGMALVRNGALYRAFGHAWTELLVGGRWVVADAALAAMPQAPRYLPFGILQNEGTGYAFDMLRLTPLWVQRVEVLGAPEAGLR